MRYDPKQPHSPANDVFVLSKGHAAPLLYSAWSEAGLFPREHLLTLRRVDSDLEGHPTPRLPCAGSARPGGIARKARQDQFKFV
jgi:transketolase